MLSHLIPSFVTHSCAPLSGIRAGRNYLTVSVCANRFLRELSTCAFFAIRASNWFAQGCFGTWNNWGSNQHPHTLWTTCCTSIVIYQQTTKKLHKILPFSPINVRNIRENNPHPLIYLNTFVLGCSNVLSSYRGDHNIICSHHVEYNVLDEKTKHVSTWLKCLKLKNQLTSNASITL